MQTDSQTTAVAYYRTSSITNVGADKDSLRRQQEAVRGYAAAQQLQIVGEYYDPGVSGADPVTARPGFCDMLAYMLGNGARIVLAENASRFARDLVVQITGHDLLKSKGISLIPVDAPNHFIDETPTAIMVRQILGAVSEFEKASMVLKLSAARDRKSVALGRRCEGRRPVAADVVAAARALREAGLSLRQVAAELAARSMRSPSGHVYGAQSIKTMLKRVN